MPLQTKLNPHDTLQSFIEGMKDGAIHMHSFYFHPDYGCYVADYGDFLQLMGF